MGTRLPLASEFEALARELRLFEERRHRRLDRASQLSLVQTIRPAAHALKQFSDDLRGATSRLEVPEDGKDVEALADDLGHLADGLLRWVDWLVRTGRSLHPPSVTPLADEFADVVRNSKRLSVLTAAGRAAESKTLGHVPQDRDATALNQISKVTRDLRTLEEHLRRLRRHLGRLDQGMGGKTADFSSEAGPVEPGEGPGRDETGAPRRN